ncbi:hypothetical protein niasHT_001258 [Heterodera trifolii]|uniref:Uncharacterized protein n=1 Tax=Heterodera trifolii TaxID=157864 RepID=A0ABD2M6Z0_9BILA
MHFDNDGDVTEDDYGENDDEFDEYDPQQNLGAQSNPQLIGEIMSTKMANQPPMFISGWEEDEQGIEQKDMSDPIEQFLSAAEEGNLHLMELLLSERPDLLMARDRDNYTALHRAAYSADPEAKTSEGWTPLHSAANWGNFEVIATLLSWGVDVNSRTEISKIVPLHLAINSMADDPHKQCMSVKYLLEMPGIEMNAMNAAGDTPMNLARRSFPAIYELLQQHMK